MTYSRRDVEVPDNPVLFIALDGWIDAGFSAATATAALLEQNESHTLALFSGDELIDYRSRRPQLRVRDGVRRRIIWPEPRFRVGFDALGTGLAFLVGPEPDFHWRPFAAEVTELALDLSVRMVIGLGAFPAPVPHTRPVAVTTTASDPAIARQVGFLPGRIAAPAGIGDVLGHACAQAGIPSVGLWARVPHYGASSNFAPGAIALLETVHSLTGILVDATELHSQAREHLQRLDEQVAKSSETASMVRELERSFDAGVNAITGPDTAIPSSEEIAAELERYLRGEFG